MLTVKESSYIDSPLDDTKTCMSFQFSAYSEKSYSRLQLFSPSGHWLWLIRVDSEDDQYKNWTFGQVEVNDYVRFEAQSRFDNDSWSAIDNIKFTNSTDCETTPLFGGNFNVHICSLTSITKCGVHIFFN